jgi:glucokinase
MVSVVGVDVGGQSTRAGLVEDGEITQEAALDTGQSPEAVVESITAGLDEILGKAGLRLEDTGGVGVGVPAFMNPKTGRYRFPNIPGADDVDLKGMLAEKLNVKHLIGNDADLTALGVLERIHEFGVMKEGVGSQGAVELVLLTLGTGIGGSVIIRYDGQRKTLSNHGGLTELGHIKVTEKPEYLCGCGAVGCVEATSSCTAIVKAVERSLEEAPEEVKIGFTDGFDAELVDVLSGRDNTLAAQVMESAGKYLGFAAANLLNSYNPAYLAFTGGGASPKPESLFFKSMLEVMADNALPEAWEAVTIVKNPDAKRYGVLGAAKAVL